MKKYPSKKINRLENENTRSEWQWLFGKSLRNFQIAVVFLWFISYNVFVRLRQGAEPRISVKENKTMRGTVRTTTVSGKEYKVWSDFIARGTFAEAEDGTIKQISWNGYISNDLTVRKAIANIFGLATFRKNRKRLIKKFTFSVDIM